MYSNTAKKVTELQEDVRKWMTCRNDGYVGTTTLVAGKEYVSGKLLCVVALMTTWSIEDINDASKCVRQVLLGSAGCIGDGINFNDVNLVQRSDVPVSRLNLIQEMNRCQRRTTSDKSAN